MTTRDDIERHLYRAITNNRLGARSHTVANAIKALGRFNQPWTVAGVSQETWRRWSKGEQKPSARSQAGLLAALRRLRLTDSREARMRASEGIHVRAWDRYEDVERNLGKTTFNWTAQQTNSSINDMLDAYLLFGITQAADVWLSNLPASGGWAQEWLHPDQHGSGQSMDITMVSLMGDPARAGRSSAARRR